MVPSYLRVDKINCFWLFLQFISELCTKLRALQFARIQLTLVNAELWLKRSKLKLNGSNQKLVICVNFGSVENADV
jgi:hypothetical protein